ncbi:MAG: winged helix-turn-helix transcriptional regulator [Thermoplasmatota archaeon]
MLERDGHGSRARIMKILRQQPGVNKTQLGKAVGLSWATTSYHLKRLQSEGAVELLRHGKRDVLCFPVSVPPKYRAWLATLRDPKAILALDALGAGEAGVREISKRAGLSESAVRRRLERMRTDGVISKRGLLRPVYARNHRSEPPSEDGDVPPGPQS